MSPERDDSKVNPRFWWDSVQLSGALDALDRWAEPDVGEPPGTDRGYACRRDDVAAVLRVYWYEYPENWRVRPELGARHERIESLLDSLYAEDG